MRKDIIKGLSFSIIIMSLMFGALSLSKYITDKYIDYRIDLKLEDK